MIRKKRPAVIKDVAALAGVSVATVSRYLNDSPHMSDETRQRIAEAITLLDYRPSHIARGLATSKVQSITVLSSETTLFGSAYTIQGIEVAAQRQGYVINISKLNTQWSDECKSTVDMTLDQHPSGIIILQYDATAIESIHYIPDDLPCVLIGGRPDGKHAHISFDEYHAGFAMTEYLLSTGVTTVHHVSVPGKGGGDDRTKGWEAALRQHGAVIYEPTTAVWSPEKARELGRDYAHDSTVEAIFAGNDEIAMGIISGLMDEGRRVPEDVRVAGFDDNPLSSIWRPAITTYHQYFTQGGEDAVTMLIKQINASQSANAAEAVAMATQPESLCIKGDLLIRESA